MAGLGTLGGGAGKSDIQLLFENFAPFSGAVIENRDIKGQKGVCVIDQGGGFALVELTENLATTEDQVWEFEFAYDAADARTGRAGLRMVGPAGAISDVLLDQQLGTVELGDVNGGVPAATILQVDRDSEVVRARIRWETYPDQVSWHIFGGTFNLAGGGSAAAFQGELCLTRLDMNVIEEFCTVFEADSLIPYIPIAPPAQTVPATGTVGALVPQAQENINNIPVGDSVTRRIQFTSLAGKLIDIDMKITNSAGTNHILNAFIGGNNSLFSHGGSGQVGRYLFEFTSCTADEDGNPVPFSLGVTASSFQTASERWWALGTDPATQGLTPVDTFVLPNGSLGTYPASGIFGTPSNDQNARLIGYENKTYVAAQWVGAANAGSSITLRIYEGPQVKEITFCEGVEDALDAAAKLSQRVDRLEENLNNGGLSTQFSSALTEDMIGRWDNDGNGPVNISPATSANIVTGFNLNSAPAFSRLRFIVSDTTNGIPWGEGFLPVDFMLAAQAAGQTADGRITVFDNDFPVVDINDAATGDLELTESGRDFQIHRIDHLQYRRAVGARLERMAKGNLDSGTQDTNDPTTLYTWDIPAGSIGSEIEYDGAGRFENTGSTDVSVQVHAKIRVSDATANDRAAFAMAITKVDAANAVLDRFTFSSTYIRDDNTNYDDGLAGGAVSMTLQAGEKFQVASARLSSQDPNDDNPANAALSEIIIDRWT